MEVPCRTDLVTAIKKSAERLVLLGFVQTSLAWQCRTVLERAVLLGNIIQYKQNQNCFEFMLQSKPVRHRAIEPSTASS